MRIYKKCGGTDERGKDRGMNETYFNEKPTGTTMVHERRKKEKWGEKSLEGQYLGR